MTSNLLITLQCPTRSVNAGPIQRVAGGHLCAQECVFVSVAGAVYWRPSFMFYLLWAAAAAQMHFLTSGKWRAEMQQGSPLVEAVNVNRLLTGSLPQALPPTEQHRRLHAAPEQLLSSSVNKSKLRCNVRSNSIYVGYSHKRTRGKETKWSGEGAAFMLFLNELV